MISKKKIFLSLLAILIGILIVIEYPRKIGKLINERLPIYINYYERYETTTNESGYDWVSTQYELTSGSSEYRQVVELISNSYYHHSIFNLFKKDVKGTDYYDIRYTNDKGKVIWFGFSDRMDMKINQHYVKIGYLTNRTSESICKKLYKIIIEKS